MKWFKWVGIVLGVLVVILIALPFFIKLNDYIPMIEKEASARLKEPVTIKSIGLSVLPLPHATIDGISVGKTGDVLVGKVTLTPDLWSLLEATKVIRSVEIKELVLTQKGIDKIPVWTKSDDKAPAGPPPVRVESIRLDNALLKLDKSSFGPFDARVNLNSNGDAVDASITTQDGKLKALVKPDNKSNYLINVTAKSWKVPAGPAIEFDELLIKGVATTSDADFSDIRAKLYGGTVSGKVAVGWKKGVQVKGNFDINNVELKSLVPLLSPGTNVTGRFSAKPVFSGSAAEAGQLMSALRLETPFNVKNGILHGVDIKQAALSLVKQGSKGGETHFDQLSGQLNMERGTQRFSGLKIASGVLAADGNVSISPKKELSGTVKAQVNALGTSAGVPLTVAGTVQSPILYPSGSALAGAALGTLIAPGVGTGLGAKAGEAIGNLFGGSKKK